MRHTRRAISDLCVRRVYRLTVTEIPEHLLKRSKAARSKADGAPPPSDDAAATPAAGAPAAAVAKADTTPAKAAAPAKPAVPEVKPDIPVVAAYKARKKVPVWAMMTLAVLPVWGIMYARALTHVEHAPEGPLGVGAGVYATNCSGCHGATGAGVPGGAYGFVEGDATKTFPHIEDQLRWVDLGSDAYKAAGVTIAGDPNREGGPHVAGANGVMPAQGPSLSAAQLLAVVCHERFTLGGVAPEGEEFEKWCSPESAAWTAAEGGTALAELHTAVDGAIVIGDTPVPGSPAGAAP